MKFPLLAALFLLLASLAVAPVVSAKTFGRPPTLGETTPISHLLADPDAYVGRTVQVKGLVVEVCALRGCYLTIAGDQPFERVHFQAADGVMVFPMSARGKVAVVEGVWQKIVRSNEFGLVRTRSGIEPAGDPETGSATETFYQLQGLGAVIEGL